MRKNRAFQMRTAYLINELTDTPNVRHGDPRLGITVIQTVIKTMKDALLRGEKVYICGFGTFSIYTRPSVIKKGMILKGSNPLLSTPEPIRLPPKKCIRFIPSSTLLAMLNFEGEMTRDEARHVRRFTQCL